MTVLQMCCNSRERMLNTSGTRLEEANIAGLQPNKMYRFRVVAHNAFGPGPSSEVLEVATDAEVHVPGSPNSLTVSFF